jgi:sugar phosphate isomerase/epimerase
MHEALNRRTFLRSSMAATAFAALPGSAFAMDAKPLFRISLAQWSLNRHLFGRVEPKLDNLDFAKTAKDLGIEAVEYVNQFFFDKGEDKKYLTEMKQRAADVGVRSLLIMVDREGPLGAADAAKRTEVVRNHHKWVDAAKFLGCHSIRVNAQSDGKLSFDEQMKLAADGLRQLTEYGAERDVNVIVENHGGLSSHGQWLAGVMKLVDHPCCGTLPDFGNFAINRGKNEWYDRYQGVAELMPYAKAVSAKAYAFDKDRPWVSIDERAGKETDFLKMMRIVLDAGYRGWVGIESEGGQDQFQGIRDTKELLERVRNKLSAEYAA